MSHQESVQSLAKEAPRRPMPSFRAPMKATLVDAPFSHPDWIFERKLDGERILIRKEGDAVTLWTRNRKHKETTYPEITDAVSHLPEDFVADAEVVAFDGRQTSFSTLQNRMQTRAPDEEKRQATPVFAYLFDLPYFAGHDLSDLPLRTRKAILRKAIRFEDPLRFVTHRNEEGEAYFRHACQNGWEGLIAKRADSPYLHSRSRDWLKFKCDRRQEFVIGGFTAPEGSRPGFGALLLGYHQETGGDLRYAGRVGTGFNHAFLRDMRGRLEAETRTRCPFEDFDERSSRVTWVRPVFVGEVRFTEWTRDGRLRHPAFLGLREDKDPRKVVREG